MIPTTGDAARGKLAADVLDGKVRLLCARTVAETERCKRDQGHDGLCRSWLDPEENGYEDEQRERMARIGQRIYGR